MANSDDDYCSLDPTKICDNCCKCLEPHEAYRVIHADMRLDQMPREADLSELEEELPEAYMHMTEIPLDESVTEEEDEFEFGKNIPPLDIDPALLAEWEAKLADIGKTEQEIPKIHGVRRKKPR